MAGIPSTGCSPPRRPDRIERARRVSCGVLIVGDGRVLIGQATRSRWWDIPKGLADPDEDFAQAALRELREETGLRAPPDALETLGRHPYRPGKDLALYRWRPGTMPDPSSLRCESGFRARDGTWLPELSRFAVLPWDEALARLAPAMAQLLRGIGAGVESTS